ncbi:MAG: hypothetical protein V4857_14290 [Pseudomonadota bacterium]
MTFKQPFMPKYGSNQVLTAGAAALIASIDAENKQLRVVNTGAGKGYFRTYDSTALPAPVATVADCPVPAGMATTVTKPSNHDRLSYISAAGTTLEVMTGEGF